MISRLINVIERALRYTREHPQIIFVLILIFIMPFLFLYSGQQFLSAGRANEDTLQKDRIGLLQDAFVSVLIASNYSATSTQTEIDRIISLNHDITDFKVVHQERTKYVTIAAEASSSVGTLQTNDLDLYRAAAVRLDDSLIFPVRSSGGHFWQAYRAVQADDGSYYFIYTKVSLQSIDALFAQREMGAYITLFFIYLFILALAYWHIRLTDYRYLYIKVRKANEMKDLFTNMIAHELRAPLTAIRGYASMMIDMPLSDDSREYVGKVKESSERLLALVNDLLDVARIQSGKLAVEKESFDASEVVMAVTDELRVNAEEKHIELTHIGAIDTHTVVGDRQRLRQALTNLVSNAIKYTESGVIEVSIQESYTKVEIRVKDTGMGISAEDQQQLFAPFFRVHSDDVSKITGSGLGMWITKQLIDLMGAKIAVESIKGVGTHIVITLNKTEPPSTHSATA